MWIARSTGDWKCAATGFDHPLPRMRGESTSRRASPPRRIRRRKSNRCPGWCGLEDPRIPAGCHPHSTGQPCTRATGNDPGANPLHPSHSHLPIYLHSKIRSLLGGERKGEFGGPGHLFDLIRAHGKEQKTINSQVSMYRITICAKKCTNHQAGFRSFFGGDSAPPEDWILPDNPLRRGMTMA